MSWFSALIGAGAAVLVIAAALFVMFILGLVGGLRRKLAAAQADNDALRKIQAEKKNIVPVILHFTDEQVYALANTIRNACVTLHESEHGPKQ